MSGGENVEKKAASDNTEGSGGGTAVESKDKDILTAQEAREQSRTGPEQEAEARKKAIEQNSAGVKDSVEREISNKDIYDTVRPKLQRTGEMNTGALDMPPLKAQSLEDALKGKNGQQAKDAADKGIIDEAPYAAASLGGAESLTLSGRRGQRKPGDSPVALADSGEAQRSFGKKPEGSDRNVERTPEEQKRDTIDGTLENYRQSLERSGVSDVSGRVAEMRKNLEDTQKRLTEAESKGHLKNLETGKPETAEQQMKRITGAINEVLEGKKGQDGPYGDKERANWAASAAAAIANPERNVNQGAHLTCALTSAMKQNLQGGDPASVLEQASSVVTRGGAFTGTDNGINGAGDRKWVSVNQLSIRPDAESGKFYSADANGPKGERSLFGQTTDALYGQKAADLKAEKAGLAPGTVVYLAANADQFGGRNSQTSTGEGLFAVDPNGKKTLIGDNPKIGLWQAAELNQHMSGKGGGFFASQNWAHENGAGKPKGYEHVQMTTFNGAADFKAKLADWQEKNGSSAQIGVNAPHLRGGGQRGHGGHAMNASIDSAGNVTFDNNWTSGNDLKNVTDAEIDRATNPDKWSSNPGFGPRPGRDTPFGPGSGRNPNESQEEYNKRREEDKKKEEEEGKKKAEEQKKKQEEEDKKRADEQKDKVQKQARVEAQYQDALAVWMASDKTKPRPERGQFQ